MFERLILCEYAVADLTAAVYNDETTKRLLLWAIHRLQGHCDIEGHRPFRLQCLVAPTPPSPSLAHYSRFLRPRMNHRLLPLEP